MFFTCQPDGVAFNAKDKECVFLEFTRPMDSMTSSEEGNWAERKKSEKNARYAHYQYFINYLSAQRGRQWKCTQINFTVGVRSSFEESQFEERLTLLGVSSSKARDKICILRVSKTLAWLYLISFSSFAHLHSQQARMGLELAPKRYVEHPNRTTPPFQKIHGPIQWARNLGRLQTSRSPPGGTAYPGPHIGPNYDERPLTNHPEMIGTSGARERAGPRTWMTHRQRNNIQEEYRLTPPPGLPSTRVRKHERLIAHAHPEG